MDRTKLSPGRRLSLGAMVAALTLLFLYGSEVLTGFRFLCACFASFFVVILVEEDLFGTAWLCFLTVSILGFILCPDRISWFFYVALLGHYGIVRRFFQKFITVPSVRSSTAIWARPWPCGRCTPSPGWTCGPWCPKRCPSWCWSCWWRRCSSCWTSSLKPPPSSIPSGSAAFCSNSIGARLSSHTIPSWDERKANATEKPAAAL